MTRKHRIPLEPNSARYVLMSTAAHLRRGLLHTLLKHC